MIKLEALENFTLERFSEVKNIERAGEDTKGFINKNDKFECEKDLADYLLGANPLNRAVVKVIEVKPEIKIEQNKIELNANNITITDKDNKKINIKKKKSSKK